MAMQVLDTERLDPLEACDLGARPSAAGDDDASEDDGPPTVARGVLMAMLISTPFWGLIAFTFYLLL